MGNNIQKYKIIFQKDLVELKRALKHNKMGRISHVIIPSYVKWFGANKFVALFVPTTPRSCVRDPSAAPEGWSKILKRSSRTLLGFSAIFAIVVPWD